MNIGDKVRVTKGEYKGLVGTVGNIMGEKVRIDNSRVDVFLWYNESDLEPISDHIDKLVEQYEDTDLIKAKYVKQIIDNHLTAEELDEIKAAEFERGYRYGINSVITNIQRFLKEIAP